MPGLENILQKIESDAKCTADELLEGAKAKAEAMTKEALLNASKLIDEAKAKMADEASLQKMRAQATAKLERKKVLLAKKQSLIDDAFEKAKEALTAEPDEARSALLKRLILLGADGEMSLQVSKKDLSLMTDAFLEDVKKALGSRATVSLGKEPAEISGGVLLKGENSDVNLSFDAILASLSDEMEAEIAGILFEGVKEE